MKKTFNPNTLEGILERIDELNDLYAMCLKEKRMDIATDVSLEVDELCTKLLLMTSSNHCNKRGLQ